VLEKLMTGADAAGASVILPAASADFAQALERQGFTEEYTRYGK
jgi:hypothetical protein